jgi:hypothetical protein
MITMRVSARSAIVLAALASLVLAGCAGTKTERYQTAIRDCPTVSILGNTGSVTRFGSGDPAKDPYTFRSDISGLRMKCDRNRTNVVIKMSFLEVASRNDGVSQSSVQFPFFVAVLYRGKMVDKKVYNSQFDFGPDEKRKATVESFDTTLYFNAPGPSSKEQERQRRRRRRRNENPEEEGPRVDPQLADYEVLIGFQLTKPELEYNVFQ